MIPYYKQFWLICEQVLSCLHTQTRNSSLEMQQSPSWRHTVHSYLRALLICDTENWCFCSCLIDTDSAWNSKCDICPCLSVCPPLSLSPTHTRFSILSSSDRFTVSLDHNSRFSRAAASGKLCPSWSALQCPATASVAHEHNNNNQSVS